MVEIREAGARTPGRSLPRWAGLAGAALHVAWRNLAGEPRRWAVSALALALAAMLVLFLEGTSRWVTSSSTAYVDHTGSQLVVAQRGIDDLLFAQSAVPEATVERIRDVPGVAAVDPIVGVNGVVSVGGAHLPVYLVGFDPGRAGGPWALDSGSSRLRGQEVVVDRGFARAADLHLGDSVTLFGRRLRVAGTSAGTDASGDFFLFAPLPVAQSIAGQGVVSYGLVRLQSGASPQSVKARIDRFPGVHALVRQRLAANDRAMIGTSFGVPLQIIAAVGLVAGLLIAGIVLYTATVEHSRDYAVLKAVGAGGGVVYGSALVQTVILSLVGALVGWALATALAGAFDALDPVVESQLDLDLVLEVSGVILVTDLLAALLPVRRVSRIDPQEVFKA
jgi:putative ABC transport system permease protein